MASGKITRNKTSSEIIAEANTITMVVSTSYLNCTSDSRFVMYKCGKVRMLIIYAIPDTNYAENVSYEITRWPNFDEPIQYFGSMQIGTVSQNDGTPVVIEFEKYSETHTSVKIRVSKARSTGNPIYCTVTYLTDA